MSKKIIVSLIIILILLAGVWAVFSFLTGTKPTSLSDVQSPPSDAIMPDQLTLDDLPEITPPAVQIKKQGLLYFSPNIINIKAGEELSVSLMANTFEKELAGLDVVLKYDHNRLRFNKAVNAVGLNLVFPKEPQENLVFSLLAPADKVFKGEIKVADLYFQALQPGQTEAVFAAAIGSTSDTNLIAAGAGEILSQADGFLVMVE